jgi:hypothetical protein
MANLTSEWLKTALEITGGFETAGNPWAGISNDFDGQGISCGILQWNIGQGSLQPLVNSCGEVAVKKHMPVYGGQLWTACHQSISKALATVRSWQPNQKLKPDVLKELRTLFGSPEMIDQQMAAAMKVGNDSMDLASRWANELRGGDPQLKEFCLFFDLVTQSGGMKGIWLNNVRAFIAETGRAKVDNAICDWILNRPPNVDHLSDGKKNAALWKNNVADGDVELFTLVYLRCLKSKIRYQVVALNRKATIALTRGWVNGGLVDLPQLRNSAPGTQVENIAATEQQKFVVNNKASLGLNLRSAPDPSVANIIATLPVNHEVIKLENSGVTNWWKVRATIDGIAKDGYVNRKYLSPIGTEIPHEEVLTHSGIVAVHMATTGKNIKRTAQSGRAYPLTEVPPVRRVAADPPEQRVSAIRQLLDWFDVKNSARYKKDQSTYCNIYAYDYSYMTGAFIPRVWWTETALLRLQAGEAVPVVYPGTQPGTINEINANALNEWFKNWGGHFGWRRTLDLDELQSEANQGKVCITVARSKPQYHHGHGHIVAVVPENETFKPRRNNGKIIATVQSQAGGTNLKYVVNHWWNDGTYMDFGHWIHD